MEDSDFCGKVVTIPQFGYTCWFNAILMASLYSTGSRNIVLKRFKGYYPDNKFLRIIKKMVEQHYIYNEKTQKFLHSFKPETILLTMLKYYPNQELEQRLIQNLKYNIENNIHLNKSFAYYNYFIINFYKNIGINYLDILYDDDTGKYMVNTYDSFISYDIHKSSSSSKIKSKNKQIIDSKPDILIYTSSKLYSNYFSIIKENLDNFEKINPDISKAFYLSNYTDVKTNINTCEDTIKFGTDDTTEYTLDSCLLFSYNSLDVYHTIAGIKCNGTKYIYNGLNKEKTTIPTSCSLMERDWDINTPDYDFCINNRECLIKDIKKEISNEYCFSFNKGDRILIYTKNQILSKNSSIIQSPSLSSVSINIPNLIDIENLTIRQLKDQIYLYNRNIYLLLDITHDYNLVRLQNILYNIIKLYYKQHIYKNEYHLNLTPNIKMKIISNILEILNNLNDIDNDLLDIKTQINNLDIAIIKNYYTDYELTEESLHEILGNLLGSINRNFDKLIDKIKVDYDITIDKSYKDIYVKIYEINKIIKKHIIKINNYKIKDKIEDLLHTIRDDYNFINEKYKDNEALTLKFEQLFNEKLIAFDTNDKEELKLLLKKLKKLKIETNEKIEKSNSSTSNERSKKIRKIKN